MNSRLQFRHHTPIFETREKAIQYIFDKIKLNEDIDVSQGFSVFAEPTVLRYKNERDESNPHVILVIGADTNESGWHFKNRFCIIDIDNTEKEIADIEDALEEAIKSLTIITKNTDTLNLYAEKTESGTVISGDVRVAENYIFDDVRKPNIILETEDGIFTYVNMNYDSETDKLTFIVNGETKEWDVNNNYLINGYYDKTDESLHLIMKDGTDVEVDLEDLIDEWDVEGEASKTPIVLTREKVGYSDNEGHNHVEPWQDVLKADVRISEDRDFNILEKTNDGKYLYVDGKASNIVYYSGGSQTTVKDVLDKLTKIGPSTDNDNIIINKVDGFFASTKLEYKSNENKLIFKASGQEDTVIALNSVDFFTNVYYDPTRETLVIQYKDNNGETRTVEIPIGDLLTDWEWEVLNEGHNVKLTKTRVIGGNDKLSADLNISTDADNILVDNHHELYVKGTADNIKYGSNSTVATEIDVLHDTDELLNNKIDDEIERATDAENTINNTIGSGFSTDAHETVTYKFNQEAQRLSDEIARATNKEGELETAIANESSRAISAETALQTAINNEVTRATNAETTLDNKIDSEIARATSAETVLNNKIEDETARAETAESALDDKIEELSANTEGRLSDINSDKSININKTNPTEPYINVNLSSEVEDGKSNLIKLNNDGLYVGVDLLYNTSSNTLTFKTTNTSKDIPLVSNSVVDRIYYDKTREAIIIEYTVNGRRMPDVVVPVGDLIDEWTVTDNTNGAIKLTKERNSGVTQDILSAEIIITNTHNDNIIVNDNGALYVSGAQIEANKTAITALGNRMTTAENNIDALESNLTAEVTRATQKENAISGVVSNLSSSLTQEITRATTAEATLDEKIDDEIARATNTEQLLRNDLTQETNDRSAAVLAEKNRAISAETTLQTAISNEVTRATNAENTLQGAISNEATRATNKETALETAINNEVTRATNKESALETAINNEVTRSTNKDAALETAITQETNDRTAAVLSEQTRATSAETELQTAINTETTRATNAEATIASNLANEITRASGAEGGLLSAINTEISNRESAVDSLDDKIDDEIARAKASENALSGQIATISNDYFIDVDNTNTVSLDKIAQASGSVIKANVNISSNANNIIQENANGIFSTVDLAYDSTSNKLTFTTTNGNKEIALVSNSIIDKIYYDVANESIVIEYTVNGQRMEDVVVPVRDLINEIDVQSTSSVELVKTSGTSSSHDVITANVRLNSTHSDNILVNDGGLYVSGAQIATNTANITSLTSRVTSAEGDISSLEGNLETAIGDFAAASGQLNTAIVNEIARSTNKDATLETAINNEVTRSTNKDNELNTALTQEVNARTAAVLAEQTRATSAETELQTAINNEVTRATNAEAMLNHLIDDLSGEITGVTGDVTTLSTRLNEEITRSTTEDSNLQTAISNETTRATNAETALQNAINNIGGVVSGDVAELAIQVANEITRSTNEDNRLDGKIDDEIARAISAETALSGAIASATTSILGDDTDTFDIHISTAGTQVHISGDVKIDNLRSNNENNAIVLGEDGGLFLDRNFDCGEY